MDPSSVSDELRCAICFRVLDDPVSPMGFPCQHIWCRACIMIALHHKQQCPQDRKALQARQLQPMVLARNLINRVVVKCKHANRGCVWTGCLEDRVVHQRKNDCLFLCRLNCGAVVRQSCLRSHTKTCSMATIPCPYARYGCAETVHRCTLEKHLSECAQEHARLLEQWQEGQANWQNVARQRWERMRRRGARFAEPERERSAAQPTKAQMQQIVGELSLHPRELGRKLVRALYNKDLVRARIFLSMPSADYTQHGPHGWTALQLSAKFGWNDCVDTLLSRRANANLSTSLQPWRPLDLALNFHHAQAAVRLQAAGGINSLGYLVANRDLHMVRERLGPLLVTKRHSLVYDPPFSAKSPMAIAQTASVDRGRATPMVKLLQELCKATTAVLSDQDSWTQHLRAALTPTVDMSALPAKSTAQSLLRLRTQVDRLSGYMRHPRAAIVRNAVDSHRTWLRLLAECVCWDKKFRAYRSGIVGWRRRSRKEARAAVAERAFRLFWMPWWENLPWPIPAHFHDIAVPELRDAEGRLLDYTRSVNKFARRLLKDAEALLVTVLRRGLVWFPNEASPLIWEMVYCQWSRRHMILHLVPFGLSFSSAHCEDRIRRRIREAGHPTKSRCAKHSALCSLLRFLSVLKYSPDGQIVCEEIPHTSVAPDRPRLKSSHRNRGGFSSSSSAMSA